MLSQLGERTYSSNRTFLSFVKNAWKGTFPYQSEIQLTYYMLLALFSFWRPEVIWVRSDIQRDAVKRGAGFCNEGSLFTAASTGKINTVNNCTALWTVCILNIFLYSKLTAHQDFANAVFVDCVPSVTLFSVLQKALLLSIRPRI